RPGEVPRVTPPATAGVRSTPERGRAAIAAPPPSRGSRVLEGQPVGAEAPQRAHGEARPSVAKLFPIDYRDNEKTAVEPVTFRPPSIWRVFPEKPEWWFLLSALAVLVLGSAVA